ncbi:sulfide:quinone oxidoreductase [Malassezia pachydermatis]|uniref:Sulfide:quinone mitochondrial n=1 Tax=Malassezia pachydermatis TaxID=77020 RepID=A0A0M9VN83_9BASI|nr:sulfide:quinone mitochondrial precursor [Malassezia pachydermatis]KOS13052.1 sulfide:quinone mitochondrial precursor [Malassezia pachydermatis]
MMLTRAIRVAAAPKRLSAVNLFSTSAAINDAAHKVVVIGGGSAGLSVSHQLLNTGKFKEDEIAVVEPSQWHNYQPGWSLVGGGLKTRESLRREESTLIDPKIHLYKDAVTTMEPEQNQVTTSSGEKLTYEHLVIASGYTITLDGISGLKEALADPSSNVASIYTYDSVVDVFPKINRLKEGRAIFTQPGSPIKCAGAPQKIMWLALDHWQKNGLYKKDASSPIKIDFATGMPTMFSVPKYSEVLNKLREERGVGGYFQHNLVAIEDNGKTAVFQKGDEKVRMPFDFLHVTPTMAPPAFLKNSSLSNEGGYANVSQDTLQHVKYSNVWSLGDSSSLPTSKTAAAITGQAPVLVTNLTNALDGKAPSATYDGYTSCPLLTEYGKVLLAEFMYGLKVNESFAKFGIDQGKPQRAFYYLKKDFFPWVYYNSMVKGTWAGPKGWLSGKRSFSTSTRAMRNTPTRHPRDPLDYSAQAVRFPLESGETFIARSAPSQDTGRVSFGTAQALFENASPLSPEEEAKMPPQLRSQSTRAESNNLTKAQIQEMQQLRHQDPYKFTASVLAKKFGCSPTFVSIVAPVSKEVRSARNAEMELKKVTWGMNKRIAQEQRRERKALW